VDGRGTLPVYQRPCPSFGVFWLAELFQIVESFGDFVLLLVYLIDRGEHSLFRISTLNGKPDIYHRSCTIP